MFYVSCKMFVKQKHISYIRLALHCYWDISSVLFAMLM